MFFNTAKSSLYTVLFLLLHFFNDPAKAELKIITTTPELGSIASAIAGKPAEVTSIATGKNDPHFIQARPVFMSRARDADLWIRNGMELETGWEMLVIDGSRNPRIRPGQPGHFDAATMVEKRLEIDSQNITRAHGDVHPSGNPHYMMDAYNARNVAKGLTERLISLEPLRENEYKQNLVAWINKLDSAMFGSEAASVFGGEKLWKAHREGALASLVSSKGASLDGWIVAMKPHEGKSIVTFHKSLLYFIDGFKLGESYQIEPLPGIPPSPTHLAKLTGVIKSKNIFIALIEPFYPLKPAQFLAENTGIKVVVVSTYASSTDPDAYFETISAIVKSFLVR